MRGCKGHWLRERGRREDMKPQRPSLTRTIASFSSTCTAGSASFSTPIRFLRFHNTSFSNSRFLRKSILYLRFHARHPPPDKFEHFSNLQNTHTHVVETQADHSDNRQFTIEQITLLHTHEGRTYHEVRTRVTSLPFLNIIEKTKDADDYK